MLDIISFGRYLGGAFDVESLVENLLRQLAGNQDITINVYDITNASEPLIMYGPQIPEGYMPLSHVSMLDFGDPFRTHQMHCRLDLLISSCAQTSLTLMHGQNN